MRFVCPSCGCYGMFEAFANDMDARVVGRLLGKLPPEVSDAVQRYLRLHAPAKHVLTFRKGRRILEELEPLIAAGTVRRNGRDWPAPAAAWVSAIDSMLGNQNLQLPLKGHGYLLEIIAGEADKAERQAEDAREQQRQANAQRLGGRRDGASLVAGIGEELDEERQQLQAAHVRTATAALVAAATSDRMKGRELDDDDARQLLRAFSPAVVERAIANWQRLRK